MALDERTLRVVERWLKRNARITHPRIWNNCVFPEGVCRTLTDEITDHLAHVAARRAKVRKCGECALSDETDGFVFCGEVWEVANNERENEAGRCGPEGKLWKDRNGGNT
jgi:hypothetical protein